MAAYTNGQLRLAVKDTGGVVKASSQGAQYDLWDNTSAPRIVFADVVQGTAQGTSDDQIITPPANLFADGSMGEVLDLELYHTAAASALTTASHVTRINVADIYRDGNGILRVTDKMLNIGDRYTKATSGTESGATGWTDDAKNLANMWSTVVRWRPPAGHRYAPRGHGYAVLDGS